MKHLKNISLFSLLIIPNVAIGAQVNFSPYAELGSSSYNVDFINDSETQSYAIDYNHITLGLTSFFEHFYVDAQMKYSINYSEASGPDFVVPVDDFQGHELYAYFEPEYEIERGDYTVTLGFNVLDNLSLFGGLRSSWDEITHDETSSALYAPDGRTFLINDERVIYRLNNDRFALDSNGLFAGAAFTHSLSEQAALTFSAAISSVEMTPEDSDLELDSGFGTSLSASIAFGWASFKLETQQYSLDDLNGGSVESSITRLSFGVRYY